MFIAERKNKGFTLVEVIIYIGLFSLLMGTAFVAAYQLIDGSGDLGKKNVAQEEGNFVLRKINWAMNNAQSFTISSGDEVEIDRYTGSDITFRLQSDEIQMQTGGATFVPLTTANIKASNLQFTPTTIGTGFTASFDLEGVDTDPVPFTITKYIRE